jgi:hypothetical protein
MRLSENRLLFRHETGGITTGRNDLEAVFSKFLKPSARC